MSGIVLDPNLVNTNNIVKTGPALNRAIRTDGGISATDVRVPDSRGEYPRTLNTGNAALSRIMGAMSSIVNQQGGKQVIAGSGMARAIVAAATNGFTTVSGSGINILA